ncbi:hypothetical protein [Schlesneria sp. T3-172]|uniref:hypothetical protein n=1 Tax=Schlesneria sphaerica TaxID=3373610 RepID=UPI0037C7182C
MTDGTQGTFSYPGIGAYESFQGTDISGIAPSVFTAQIHPEYGIPAPDGDIVLQYGDSVVTLRNMHVDRVDYDEGTGGKVATVRFLDERWKWAYYKIVGRYNIRLPNNFVDPAHEKTPRELATLCFQAMGVTRFDVSALPNLARPDVDWQWSRPAEELANLCDELGCRIVPRRSDGAWVVVQTGFGADLPDNGWPYNDHGSGIDPKETPDYIEIVTAPISYQCALELEPCGKDVNQAWKSLDQLSYVIDPHDYGYGFFRDPWYQSGLSPDRIRQADGSEISPRELGVQTLHRCFRINETPANVARRTTEEGEKEFYLPGYDGFVTRKQLLPFNELVETYTDPYGAEHRRAALMFGEWWGELGENNGNHAPGTRLDYQESTIYAPEERASFTVSVDPIDTDRTIITTSKPMLHYMNPRAFSDGFRDEYVFSAARMFLVCTVNVRHKVTWQPIRYSMRKHIGSGNNPDFCLTIVKNDIQPWWITDYDAFGVPLHASTPRNNELEVRRQCEYYLEAYAQTFQTVASESKVYYGLYPIDMDGAIAQVTYRISPSGADTIISRGTEHNFDIPSYEQRRQRDGRMNAAEKQKLLAEIQDRKTRLLGVNNT